MAQALRWSARARVGPQGSELRPGGMRANWSPLRGRSGSAEPPKSWRRPWKRRRPWNCSREGLPGVGGMERCDGDSGNWGGPPRPDGLRTGAAGSCGSYNPVIPGKWAQAGWASEAAVVPRRTGGQRDRRPGKGRCFVDVQVVWRGLVSAVSAISATSGSPARASTTPPPEPFFALKEEIGTRCWPDRASARAEIFALIETFCNRRPLRKHPVWGYVTPLEIRQRHEQEHALAA